MELIDIGANLTHDSFRSDLPLVLERARAAKVSTLVITGASLASAEAAIALAKNDQNLWATAGIHPHHAETVTPAALDRLAQLALDPKVVALGEMGLDYFRDFTPRDIQLHAFESQLQLAVDIGKPVFLHERDAASDFIGILKRYRSQLTEVVVHCFTGSEASLESYLALDCHIGITGWICDERRGKHLHDLVPSIPANRLMIETDAPYLLPRTLKPKPKDRRCEPSHLVEVCRFTSALRGQSASQLAAETTATAKKFFRL